MDVFFIQLSCCDEQREETHSFSSKKDLSPQLLLALSGTLPNVVPISGSPDPMTVQDEV